MADGEWGRQVPAEGDDEVTDLARAFNEMSTRVADAYRTQQEFVGDVSHELRTPVTSIRGFADAIVDGTVSGDEGVKRAASIISAEAGNLAELTATLLALADLDAGGVSIARAPVDVDALGATLRDRFAPGAAAAGLVLDIAVHDGRPLGDDARLLQAASVLLDNAIRHARTGGRVRVVSETRGPSWLLEVEDDGPGVPVADRERIFGRFTRLDSARAAGGGSGLGLAICRRLMTLMGGSVRVGDSAELGGACFTLELPDAGAASTRTQPAFNARATPRPDSEREGVETAALDTDPKESQR